MPCEGCNSQFTVFKRKRICSECRRYFCNHCLTKRNQNILCERCVIFAKRPLTRADLLNLKPKDLIFYLQSKHISTTGCVEKEELVNLILANTDLGDQDQNQSSSTDDTDNLSNTFDQLKQTCQNLFNSFTDKITSDLGFETKQHNPTTSPTSSNTNSNFCDSSIGIKTREIPTYSESLNRHNSTMANNTNPNNCNGGIDGRDRARAQRPSNLVPNSAVRTSTTTAANAGTCSNTNYLSPNASNVPNDVFCSISSPSSPINSISSISSHSISSQAVNQQQQLSNSNRNNNNSPLSSTSSQHQNRFDGIAGIHKSTNSKMFKSTATDGCDCSDDEIITNYNTRQRQQPVHNKQNKLSSSQRCGMIGEGNGLVTVDKCSPVSQLSDSAFEDHIAGPSGSTVGSSSNSRSSNENSHPNVKSSEGSSGSSFEELGAVGGGSMNGACSTSSDNDNWQMVNRVEIPSYSSIMQRNTTLTNEETEWYRAGAPGPSRLFNSSVTSNSNNKNTFPSHSKPNRRITRRRSDSFIYNRNHNQTKSDRNETPIFQQLNEDIDEYDHTARKLSKRVKKCCKKCGKSKKSIEGRVDRFRRQLESSKLSASEIKQELAEFVQYLEQRAESFGCTDETEDCSGDGSSENSEANEDDESNNAPTSSLSNTQQQQPEEQPLSEINMYSSRNTSNIQNDNDGIHVYAPEEANSYQQTQRSRHDPRFINLSDFSKITELDNLSVKQLKEILLLNRVDFKGCCEKKELLDKVKLLWKDLQSCPDIDKLPSDELCKVCMDAPIECIILECGHMATCTNCGKVLSECPICRQYIVRVVRFFKA